MAPLPNKANVYMCIDVGFVCELRPVRTLIAHGTSAKQSQRLRVAEVGFSTNVNALNRTWRSYSVLVQVQLRR